MLQRCHEEEVEVQHRRIINAQLEIEEETILRHSTLFVVPKHNVVAPQVTVAQNVKTGIVSVDQGTGFLQ